MKPIYKIQSSREEGGQVLYQVVDVANQYVLDVCETLREAEVYLEGYERLGEGQG